jgi:hypothetical protein
MDGDLPIFQHDPADPEHRTVRGPARRPDRREARRWVIQSTPGLGRSLQWPPVELTRSEIRLLSMPPSPLDLMREPTTAAERATPPQAAPPLWVAERGHTNLGGSCPSGGPPRNGSGGRPESYWADGLRGLVAIDVRRCCVYFELPHNSRASLGNNPMRVGESSSLVEETIAEPFVRDLMTHQVSEDRRHGDGLAREPALARWLAFCREMQQRRAGDGTRSADHPECHDRRDGPER